jgi:uncharacterized membrane protein
MALVAWWRMGARNDRDRSTTIAVIVDSLGTYADVLLPAVPSVRLEEGSRMGRIHHEYHIDAPPEVAWDLGRDPDRMPEWNTTTVSVKDVSGPLDREGATYTTVSKIAGRPLEIQWQVEKIDPGREAEVTASAPRGGSARVVVRYEPEGSGTKVITDLDYELPMGFLGDVADKLFGERAMIRDVRHSGENFKALVEEEAMVPTASG